MEMKQRAKADDHITVIEVADFVLQDYSNDVITYLIAFERGLEGGARSLRSYSHNRIEAVMADIFDGAAFGIRCARKFSPMLKLFFYHSGNHSRFHQTETAEPPIT